MKETNELSKNQSKDPICGMTVNKATALHSEQDGKTFYFCGSKCQQKFRAAPKEKMHEQKDGGCC